MLVAELEQFGGAGKIVGQYHVARRRNARLGFGRFDNETAADRVIGLLPQLCGVAEGGQGHGVGVIGQALVQQQKIMLPAEGDGGFAGQV
ncbi:hypothetical protein D3C84_1136450 [compost metagenome]